MKGIINKILSVRVVALMAVAFITTGAWAIVPTVVWETGAFGKTKIGSDGKRYSITLNPGNSINSDGNIVIGGNMGATIDVSGASTANISVLIEYEGLSQESTDKYAIAGMKDSSNNTAGLRADSGKLKGFYSSTVKTLGSSDITANPGSGTILMSYGSGNALHGYAGDNRSNLSGGVATGVTWSNKTISLVSIGGAAYSTTDYPGWKDLVIKKVALFVGMHIPTTNTTGIPVSKLQYYKFPSELVADTNDDYEKWAYADKVITWTSTVSDIGSMATFSLFDRKTGADASPAVTYTGNTSTNDFECYRFFSKMCYVSMISSTYFSDYLVPGPVLRLAAAQSSTATKTIGGSFSPLTLGGLIVESGAGEYTFSQNSDTGTTRSTILGDPTGETETWFDIDENLTFARGGVFYISGTVNFDIAASKTLTLQSGVLEANYPKCFAQVGQNCASTVAGGHLKMHGGGQIAATKLTAEGTCLDFSDLAADRASSVISGELVVNDTTTYVFPAGVGATYPVATSVTGTSAVDQTFTINSHEYKAPLTFSSGNAVFPAVATLAEGAMEVTNVLQWDNIVWDATPAKISSTTPVVINVTDDTLLMLTSPLSVKSLVFNISAGKTLRIYAGGITATEGFTVTGGGTFEIYGTALNVTGNMSFSENATLAFHNMTTDRLTVNGTLTVPSGKTLTLAPATITGASATMLTATSIAGAGTIALSAPTESGYTYTMLETATTRKLVRTPNVAFSYDGTIGATPSGWFTAWGGEHSGVNVRVGPNSSCPIVYEVYHNGNGDAEKEHPYYDLTARSSVTLAVYADLSQVANSGRKVIASFGKSANGLMLYRDGDYVRASHITGGNTLTGTASVALPAGIGYHLYTVAFDPTGSIALYLDNGSVYNVASSLGTMTLDNGFKIGGMFLGLTTNAAFSENPFGQGVGTAFAAIRGYDAVLEADHVAKLSESFPATSGNVTWDVLPNNDHDKSYVYNVASATFGDGNMLGISHGTMNILSNATVNVGHFRTLNHDDGNDRATVNIFGTLNVTSSTTNPNVWNETGKGILLGHWKGQGIYNVTGQLLGENTYLELYYTAGQQTFTIDGGLVSVKGIYARNGYGPATFSLTNGGLLEVKEVPTSGNDGGYGDVPTGTINYSFGYGTYRALGDMTHNQAISFTGTLAQPTTLDPCGHTFTMADGSLAGSGYIDVASSAEGATKGMVVLGANADFGGYVILNDENRDLINLAAYKGKVRCQSISSATLSVLDGFGGTVCFFGSDFDEAVVDVRSYDLSGLNIALEDGAILNATAGQEGTIVSGASGTTLKLYVSEDAYRYEGYLFTGTTSGTLQYYHPNNSEGYDLVSDAAALNGTNLLPFYQIWEVSGGAGSGNVNVASNWKGGEVPGTRAGHVGEYGNAAFHVTGDSEITVTVDATMTFGEIQVYGSGTVVFKTDGTHYLSANYLSMTAGVRVELSGTVVEDGAVLIIADGEILADSNTQTITIGSGAAMVMVDVDFSAKLICSGKLTTYGDVDMSTTWQKFNYGSQLTVATGTAKVQVEEQGFQGAITVASGATLKNVKDADAMRYSATSSAPTLVDVSGTLDMGNTRWSLSTYNPIIFRDGATLVGTGDSSNGGFDWIDNATSCSLTIEGDLATEMKFKIRGGAEVSFDIESGKTLTHTGGWTGGSSGQLKLTGGRIITNSQPANKVDIASTATFTLQNAPWDSNPVEFTGSGILEFSATSSDYGNTVSGITTGNFTGKVKMTNSANKKCNFNPSGAATFTAAPEFVLEANNTHIAGWYDNNANHPFEVKNLSGSGSFKSEWNVNAHSIIVKTTQTRDTEFSGMFSSSHYSGDRVMNLTVVGDNSGDVHSLTVSAGQNTSSTDTAQAASRLTVSDGAKVVFTSAGGWGYGAVSIGNGGWLQSTNATAVTKLTLTDGANIVLPTSSSTLTGITSLTFTSGNTWITFANGVPAVDTVLIDWTGASLESAPAGYFKFADSSLNATYYLEKSTTGLTLKAVVKIDDGATHEVGYINPNNGAATITNAVANVTVPVSSTGLLTVLNGTSVTYNYSGSNITDENKGSTVLAFATDANGQIIPSTQITSLCTVTVADGKITVALDDSKVAPNPVTDDETNPPMAMTADSVVFALPMKAGLWYSIESGSSVDGSGNIVGGTLSTPQYSSSTSTQTLSIGFSGTVKYFKPAVAASKAALVKEQESE